MMIDATILLTSTVIVSIISLIGSIILYKLNRKAVIEDRRDELQQMTIKISDQMKKLSEDQESIVSKIRELQSAIDNLREANRIILHSEIMRLAKPALRAGKIAHEEKNFIIRMHSIYHEKLGGNGELDELMDDLSDIDVDY